jgi:hypothetical protein
MGTEAPTPIVIPVHAAPKKAPCPKCGKHGRRKRKFTRRVRTVAYKAIAYLEITCGEYAAQCDCCTTFRNSPEVGCDRASATVFAEIARSFVSKSPQSRSRLVLRLENEPIPR